MEINKLVQAVEDATSNGTDCEKLRMAAIEWSKFCLDHLDETSLSKGLKISESIALFCNQIQDINK